MDVQIIFIDIFQIRPSQTFGPDIFSRLDVYWALLNKPNINKDYETCFLKAKTLNVLKPCPSFSPPPSTPPLSFPVLSMDLHHILLHNENLILQVHG